MKHFHVTYPAAADGTPVPPETIEADNCQLLTNGRYAFFDGPFTDDNHPTMIRSIELGIGGTVVASDT